jgi:hypothetical protein
MQLGSKMFILNSKEIKNKIGFKEKISNYLENHGAPLLTIDGDIYYFAQTKILEDVLKTSPLWVKWAKQY